MSTVGKRTITTTRHEYIVPSPASHAEVEMAIAMAREDVPLGLIGYDDVPKVEARDDEIVVWWEERR